MGDIIFEWGVYMEQSINSERKILTIGLRRPGSSS